MEEAERLCQRIVIVDHGKVIADDTLRGLEKQVPPSRRLSVEIEVAALPPAWLPDLRALSGVETAELSGETLSVTLADLERAPAVLAFLSERRQRFSHFRTERADLEDIFLRLTGHTLRDPT